MRVDSPGTAMRTPLSGQPGVLRPDAEADISAIFAPRLYLVDTDPQTRAQLASCLREKGFDVVAATDRDAAPPPVDVLIIALAAQGPHANVPAWLATKPTTPLIVLDRPQVFPGRIAPLGFVPDARLSLPVPPRKLVATIRQALSLARIESADLYAAAARIYRFAGWTLNSETRQLTSGDGTAIQLDPREGDVLKALLTFPRQVLTRAQLIAMVWGTGEAIENRTLDRPITRLRRHLGDDVRFPLLLKTVVGVGYRLDIDVDKTG
jgi:two-component system, OmpR family, response regulator